MSMPNLNDLAAEPVFGRRRFRSGLWHLAADFSGSAGLLTLTQDLLVCWPFTVGVQAGPFDIVTGEMTVAGGAGSAVRVGLYADDGSGYPGALVADFGTLNAQSTGAKLLGIPKGITLSPAVYWQAIVAQGGAPQMRVKTVSAHPWIGSLTQSNSSPTAYTQAGVNDVLPTTFSTTPAISQSPNPAIMYHAA